MIVIVPSIVCVAVLLRTKCRSEIVVMMRAASKQNVRTEGDKRYAMDEAGKHEDLHSEIKLMAVGLFAVDDSRSIAIVSKSQSVRQRVLYGRDDLAKGHATRSRQ